MSYNNGVLLASQEHDMDVAFLSLVALVCRHDIPLFLVNVDTPGEQQKYAVALIKHLVSHLPTTTSITVLYDIGCMLDRSVNLYNIFSPGLTERLMFATSVMHAYGHQWSCQLIYNPRLKPGLGLTDGEGVERLWSCLRNLIGITQSSGDLRGWLRRKVKEGIEKKGAIARADLESCGRTVQYLQQQWEDQRHMQTSIRAYVPTQLRKELDAVLTLQGHADTIESAIQATRLTLTASVDVPHHNFDLSQLSYVHGELCNKIDQLYGSLNVSQTFPELASLDITFVQTLLLARDLKINIRTKLHQQTCKSISCHKPALLAAIRKFNSYIGELEHLSAEKKILFPLPHRLSTDLAHLKHDEDLMQDIWVQVTANKAPRWLVDADVRRGIHALLQLD
ncbi:hypothetical protein EDD18DRAFT_1308484 [Armillaria luteobubalina]|uniref:Uncharacterized protein n=1 Tax=Armillaria luteobubalina TaxID=153913 RepID=A0AA39QAF8_9AGAR|nr:hypothetical protein EDD18DRAFT_1308484 [Armillaria luteobubalina]